ncbi:hypothetical protein QZH41_012493 [Actinostola sp. cb2023]|nr:hypothetical protein QZH41_012493 [Actinostola sp. cb2023]
MLSTLAQQINDWISLGINFIYERCLNRVPVRVGGLCTLVSVMISTVMILIIATFAYYMEGWSFINGIYFGFITLTTIGFGDFVPLHPSPDRDPDAYPVHVVFFTITSIIYFTIGLAVVSSVLISFRNAMEERKIIVIMMMIMIMMMVIMMMIDDDGDDDDGNYDDHYDDGNYDDGDDGDDGDDDGDDDDDYDDGNYDGDYDDDYDDGDYDDGDYDGNYDDGDGDD